MSKLRASLLATRILTAQPRLRPQHLEALLLMANSAEATTAARALVESHCAAGRRSAAFNFLLEQRPRAVEPFEPLLVACAMDGDDAALRMATRLMRESGAAPTESTYGLLVRARLDCGDTDRALKVCEGALAAGMAPPPADVKALLLALSEAGLSGSALELMAALRVRHGRLVPADRSDVAIHALLDGAARAHEMPLECLAVWNELKHHGDEAAARQLADDLLRRCLRAGNLNGARALHRQLGAEGVCLGPEALEWLLRALLEASQTPEALKLWDEQSSRHAEPFPWPSVRWALVAHADEAHPAHAAPPDEHTDELDLSRVPEGVACRELEPPRSSTPLDELDLSRVPEGVACIGAIRFFQRLAALAVAERPQLQLPTRVLLRAQPAHAAALIRTAASLVPPLQIERLPGRSEGAPSAEAELIVDEQALSRWTAQVRSERSRAQRTNQFAAVAAGHNALWTLALVGSGWIV